MFVRYLGSVTMSWAMIPAYRGRSGTAVPPQQRRCAVEVIGAAPNPEARQLLQSAAAASDVTRWGRRRRRRWPGSVVPWPGCACWKDLPNYQVSLPTKILWSTALGVPTRLIGKTDDASGGSTHDLAARILQAEWLGRWGRDSTKPLSSCSSQLRRGPLSPASHARPRQVLRTL